MLWFVVSIGVLAGGAMLVSHLIGSAEQKANGATHLFGISTRPFLTVTGILASVFLAPFWWPLGVVGLIAALGAQWTPFMAAIKAAYPKQLSAT